LPFGPFAIQFLFCLVASFGSLVEEFVALVEEIVILVEATNSLDRSSLGFG
jgi:hypothetical protein